MASFIKQFHSTQPPNNKPLHDNQYSTQDLRQKMKQLQQQIESLQQLKSKTSHPSHKPPKSHQPSNVTQRSIQKQPAHTITPIQPLKLDTIKSQKVTQLVTQIHAKSSARSRRKLSIQHKPLTGRQSVNTIKQTLEKIDVSSGRKKKRAVGVNVYELKGLKHNVDSNIFNVTIAEIMTQEHEKYELVKEIKRLKDKLKDLQQKKLENEQRRKIHQQQQQEQYNNKQQQQDNSRAFIQTQQQRRRIISHIQLPLQPSTARKSQTLTAGRIYSRSRVLMTGNYNNYNQNQDQSQVDNSRVTDQLVSIHRHSIQLRRNSNPLTWNPEVTLGYKNQKKAGEIRTHRTVHQYRGSNSIDVKMLSGEFHNNNDQENNPTSRTKPFFKLGNKKQIVKQFNNNRQSSVQFPQSEVSESFKQSAKSKEQVKSRQLVPQLKIHKMKQKQSIPNDFIPNFRQSIKDRLLSIKLPPQPSQYETQSQLELFGQILFSLFDIYLDEEVNKKQTQYKVTKYKNCVLYRLNDEKNIVWYYDGRFYFGGWQINLIGEGKKEGFGYEILPNQYTYQGYFTNNKRNGYGIMFNYYRAQENKNVIYEGQWKQGLKHGKGYQAEADLQYLGDFEGGLQTGQCKIKTQTTYYQGQIKESIKQGKGHQILKNGDQYHGQFRQNMFHGIGQYKWKSGAYFYGNFVKGIRKGQGIWISNLNNDQYDIYKGSYEQNKKNGFGVYQWANGTIYEGYFKNDLRHDQGLMKYPNGKAAKFMWRDGNKANKLYSKEEEEYRCNRNSAIKICQTQSQNDQEDSGEETIEKFQNVFRKAIMNELSNNQKLMLLKKIN